MAQAQGYRQLREETLQGPGCYAQGALTSRKDNGKDATRQEWKEGMRYEYDDIGKERGTVRLISNSLTDWLWFQQEDPPHDALRPQGFPRQQHPRPRPPPHAQQDLRRRVRHPPESLDFQHQHTNHASGLRTPSPPRTGSPSSPARRSSASRSPTARPSSPLRHKREACVFAVGDKAGMNLGVYIGFRRVCISSS